MHNELADVERLKLFCVMNRELRNPVAGLREARAMVELARHSSKLCTRMLATDRRALPAAVDHDLATAGQAFAEVAWRIDEFAQLVERAEAESGTVWAGDLEGLAQALEPAAAALERAARAAGTYLKLLEQAPAAAPTKRATVGEIEAHFVGLKPHVRASVLQLSQEEIVAYLREQGLRTTARTLRKTHSYRVVN